MTVTGHWGKIMIGSTIKGLLIRCWAVWSRDSRPKVVFYHDVGKRYTPMGTDLNVFLHHMACLRKEDVVCFDDGFRGLWDNREQLAVSRQRLDTRVIVFLAVELVGKQGYLTWDEIRELQDKYGIEFQCHTWSHQTLVGPYNKEVQEPENGRTAEWYQHELVGSKAELERQLGKKVTALCFPVGYFSDDVIRLCKTAGYEKVYASYPGNATDDYVQPRCLAQDLSVGAFNSVLRGGMSVLTSRYLKLHKFS